MPHNSLLELGLETNRTFTHQITQDTRAAGQRRPDETAFNGARISITLRCVGTFLRHDPDGVRVYGQGASASMYAADETRLQVQCIPQKRN